MTNACVDPDKRQVPAPTSTAAIGAFRCIVTAVDNSEQAGLAADLSARLASACGARLVFAHVAHVPPATDPDLYYEQIELLAVSRDLGRDLLKRTATRTSTLAAAETQLREGDPAREISDAARELRADLIVIGTQGRGRVAEVITGSVAHAVVRTAPCPVMVIGHLHASGTAAIDAVNL